MFPTRYPVRTAWSGAPRRGLKRKGCRPLQAVAGRCSGQCVRFVNPLRSTQRARVVLNSCAFLVGGRSALSIFVGTSQCVERFVHNCFTARPYRCGRCRRSPLRTLTSAAPRGSCGAARYRNGMRRSSSSAGVRKRMMRTSQTRRRRSSIRVFRMRRAAPAAMGPACPHPGVINWRRRRRLTQSRCMSGMRSNANATLGTSRDGGRAQRGYGICCMLKVHKWVAAAAEHPADVYPRDAA